MCRRCADDYNWCATYRTNNDSSRKTPNDPNYFGLDEWNFIRKFGPDMYRNFQQMQHLKATTTGTAKIINWLLQGELQARLAEMAGQAVGVGGADMHTRMHPYSMRDDRARMGAEFGEPYSRRGLRARMSAEFDNPYLRRDGRTKFGPESDAQYWKRDAGLPPIPLTCCFDDAGRWIPCDTSTAENLKQYRQLFGADALWNERDSALASFPGFANWHTLTEAQRANAALLRALLQGGLQEPYNAEKPGYRFSHVDRSFGHGLSYTYVSKAQRAQERNQFNALVSNLTNLYAGVNKPDSKEEESDIEIEQEDIYKWLVYGSIAQSLGEQLAEIKKLNFNELLELLRKEKHTQFEPVLFHEPFDPEKPWTWMSTFPKKIPEKYLKRLSPMALAALQDWQQKQELARPGKQRKRK